MAKVSIGNGKKTSGRYVYRGSVYKDTWYWQCDLHPGVEDPESGGEFSAPGTYGDASTWRLALGAALVHAETCPFSNA